MSSSTGIRLRRTNSAINKKIIDKFYMPYIEKRFCQIALNENLGHTKKDTRKSANDNFDLDKKKVDIEKLTKKMIRYNNPSNFLNKKKKLMLTYYLRTPITR